VLIEARLRISSGSSTRATVVAGVVAMMCALALGAGLPSSAGATSFTFCTSVQLGGYPGDRCAHPTYRMYSYVRVTADVSTPICAVVKTDPGGLGGNATSPGCAYFSTGPVYSYCGSPYS
jgi:hypothetical protein